MKRKRLFKRNLFKKGINLHKELHLKSTYALFVSENQMLTKKQIECCRVVIRREIKKRKYLHLIPCFRIPLTQKATGVRMGKGKGPIKDYQAQLRIGDCIIQFNTDHLKTALKVLAKVSYKLAVRLYLYSSTTEKQYFLR